MKQLATFLSVCALGSASCGAALVIGGFNTARVGAASISEGPFTEEVRAAMVAAFPGTTFVGSNTLSASFLSSVDFLIVGAPTFTSPAVLSSAEQTELLNYVRSGGGALIFSDNDSYAGVPASDDANETFLDPFGIDSTGRVSSPAPATASNAVHPVMNGPFGTVTTLWTNFGGWFDNFGANATALARYDTNNEPALLAIAPGGLSPGSGGVVLVCDADLFVDSADGGQFGTADNQKMILNSVAFAVPEASSAMLIVTGALLMGARRKAACRGFRAV